MLMGKNSKKKRYRLTVVAPQVMWCCITCRYPILPPMAKQEPAIQNAWTYGDKIMDNTYVTLYGQQLCELVASCLAVKPIDRPSLQQLRDSLNNLRPPPVSQDQEFTKDDKDWMDRFLRHPSIPSARPLARAFG